ncbi:MAG: F420-dependent NADP oxidoreductase [Bacteroidota bacterium]|nr:F420-dependent NADP oxidoreductase [Bacteroidota bacterium]
MKAPENKHVILIGAGNVATQLGLALHAAGYKIPQVYSRTIEAASILAKRLGAEPISSLKILDPSAAIYIIAVKDDVIPAVAAQISLKNKIVVHTSGSADLKELKKCSENYGVFYPLQSFSRNKKAEFRHIPVCIEANNSSTATSLQYFARSISYSVHSVNSKQRSILHLAAVFANNFSNHLFHHSEQLLRKNQLSFNLLTPLIEETVQKLRSGTPDEMQTGPAIRQDKKVIKKHLELLKKEKSALAIYQLMTKSIGKSKNKNKL